MTIGEIISVSFLALMVVLIGLGLRRNARSGPPTEGGADQSGAYFWGVDTHHSNDHSDASDGGN